MIVMYAEFYRKQYDTNPIKIDYRDVISVENDMKDRADMTMPSYGLISNSARIEFRVSAESVIWELRDYINRARCIIYLKNTITGKGVCSV